MLGGGEDGAGEGWLVRGGGGLRGEVVRSMIDRVPSAQGKLEKSPQNKPLSGKTQGIWKFGRSLAEVCRSCKLRSGRSGM